MRVSVFQLREGMSPTIRTCRVCDKTYPHAFETSWGSTSNPALAEQPPKPFPRDGLGTIAYDEVIAQKVPRGAKGESLFKRHSGRIAREANFADLNITSLFATPALSKELSSIP